MTAVCGAFAQTVIKANRFNPSGAATIDGYTVELQKNSGSTAPAYNAQTDGEGGEQGGSGNVDSDTVSPEIPALLLATKLEVGKTYIFENARAKERYNYHYLCDLNAGDALECSETITDKCIWIVESGSTEGAIAIKNVATGGYLFDDNTYHSQSTNLATDIYVFYGSHYSPAIGLSTSPDATGSTFLNAYNHNQYVCAYSFDAGSEWYAYECAKRNPNLPEQSFEVNVGKVRYTVECPQLFPWAIAVGVASGEFSLDGLEIADFVTYEGVNYPVLSIAANAFKGLTGFTGTLTLGRNIQVIGENAFSGCTGFTGVLELPGSVTLIEGEAFNGCSGLTSLEFNNGLATIGSYAFSSCRGLSGSVVLPESLTSIGGSAFSGCYNLTSLKLNNGLATIGSSAFFNCTGLNGSLVLPESLTSIGESAFDRCSGFSGNLVLPESLTSIGGYAFERCSGFSGNLEIPDKVTSIESGCFSGCSGLNGTLIIPESVNTISYNAFADTNFEKVVCYNPSAPECSSNAFDGARKEELQVPESSVTAYRLKVPWSEFKNIYTIAPLSAIEFAEAEVVCPLGGTVKLKVNKIPYGAAGEINYISSNSSVATVDANGVVTGVSVGSTAIIAMSGSLTATCVVSVEDPTIPATALEMEGIAGKVGESIEIRTRVLPENVTDPTVLWSSSNAEVASVDSEGKVWFNAAGSAVVTAECQGHEFSVPFIVEEVVARALNVFPVEAIGGVGHEFSLLALHEPENTTDKSVTWESSDPAVAAVGNDGRVSLVSVGTAQITGRSGEHTATCSVTVDDSVNLTEMAASGVVIDVVAGGIVVRNAPLGESVAVYTVDGKVANGAIVESEETKLGLAAGIYIVKVSPATIAKVIIK